MSSEGKVNELLHSRSSPYMSSEGKMISTNYIRTKSASEDSEVEEVAPITPSKRKAYIESDEEEEEEVASIVQECVVQFLLLGRGANLNIVSLRAPRMMVHCLAEMKRKKMNEIRLMLK